MGTHRDRPIRPLTPERQALAASAVPLALTLAEAHPGDPDENASVAFLALVIAAATYQGHLEPGQPRSQFAKLVRRVVAEHLAALDLAEAEYQSRLAPLDHEPTAPDSSGLFDLWEAIGHLPPRTRRLAEMIAVGHQPRDFIRWWTDPLPYLWRLQRLRERLGALL